MKNRNYINLELCRYRSEVNSNDRLKLLEKERSGVVGELKTNGMLDNVLGEKNYLRNILLTYDGSYFQIDHMIVTDDRVLILDSKNFNCDFEICDGQWTFIEGKSASNPISQMERAKGLLQKWLANHQVHLPVWGFIVWTGSGQIYGLNKQEILISLSKAERIVRKLVQVEQINLRVMELIRKERVVKSPFFQKIEFADAFNSGLNCPVCFQMNFEGMRRQLKCGHCGSAFDICELIYRNILFYCSLYDVEEFSVLDFYRFAGNRLSHKTITSNLLKLENKKLLVRTSRSTYKITKEIEYLL